ncbi:glycosyltransferase [Patescibacteria group bacterium]|nr:glycosyltransferase [Patescibacteria group bacterium]
MKNKEILLNKEDQNFGIWPACQTVTFQEAISCSLPVIVKHYYGTEYLTQYQNGFQLYSDSVEEIIEKIEFLLSYPDVLQEMRERAQKLAENILSYELIAKKSLQPLYKRHYLTKNSYDARTRTDKNKKIRSII